MAYIVSTPPEMTMGEDGLGLTLNEDAQDVESFVEQGLMVLTIQPDGRAISYYADVREDWEVVQDGSQVSFLSEADTLYGKLNDNGMLQLRSTIDEFPSEYYFTPYSPSAMDIDFINSRWFVNEGGVLKGKTLEFKSDTEVRIWTDGKSQQSDYFLIPLGDYFAIELSSNEFENGFVIIYLEKLSGKTISGLMYVVAQGQPPKKEQISLVKQ